MVKFPMHGAGAAIGNGLLGRNLKSTVLNGAAASTNIALAGIDPNTDELLSVIETRSGLKTTIVAGGVAGNLTVTGIATTDRIASVLLFQTALSIATVADLTSQFSITAANTINNTGGTATTNGSVLVFWEDNDTAAVDRTSTTDIVSYGNIRCSDATANSKLHVLYSDRQVNN